MKEKKYCEFVIEGILECPEGKEQEVQKKIIEAMSYISKDDGVVKINFVISKFSDMDVAISVLNKSEEDIN